VAALPDSLAAEAVDLHRWHPRYAVDLCDAVTSSLDELRPWMPWAQEAPTVDGHVTVLTEGDARFAADEEWPYVVVDPGTGRVIGSTGLHRRDPSAVEIGYWVRTDATGRGVATMAARALTTAAFAHLPHLDEVEIRMDVANRRSAAVPPRLGFHHVGDVDQEPDSPGQTGRWMRWTMQRDAWRPPGGP
jgi:RimJ/RimL family protein N-acetyltransferase